MFKDKLDDLNANFKPLLEDKFGKKYVSDIVIDKSSDGDSVQSYLSYFAIKRNDVVIKDQITSQENLTNVKNIIITDYEKFTQDCIDYYGRVHDCLDDKMAKSLGIIIKTFKSRMKKLKNALDRFTVQDSWNIATLGLEFEQVLVRFLKDLIENTIRPISTGLSEHQIYQDILIIFNTYLARLGVSTCDYKAGHKVCDDDWNYLRPVPVDDSETPDSALKNMIKTVYSYPYVIGDSVVVLEGEVVLWKVI